MFWLVRRHSKDTMSSNNWSASANSAFGSRAPGGGGGGGAEQRRAAEAASQMREQREAALKRAAEVTEAKHLAEATNFGSDQSYPSLGGSMTVAKPKPAMNFSKTVATMAARAKADEEAAAVAAAQAAAEAAYAAPTIQRRLPAYQLDARYQEMDGELQGYESAPPEEEEEEEGDGEFNADLGSTRRRGDKGIW